MKNNTQQKFPADFLDFIDENTLLEIAGGKREKFTEIWMVKVDERIFARSWNKNFSGWMKDFLQDEGKIKYGEKILLVSADKIDKADLINQKISEAYLEKYTQDYNVEYARGIADKEYFDFTIEFHFQSGL